MTVKERLVHEIDGLSDEELARMAEFLSFLKFRSRIGSIPAIDEGRLKSLYAEFADEDRDLAEEGLADYAGDLAREDAR